MCSFISFTLKYYFGIQRIKRIYFFFQAEDGIRDGRVTGVQTCALPISDYPSSDPIQASMGLFHQDWSPKPVLTTVEQVIAENQAINAATDDDEIGRASCRERV